MKGIPIPIQRSTLPVEDVVRMMLDASNQLRHITPERLDT